MAPVSCGACAAVGRKSLDKSWSLIVICGVFSSGHMVDGPDCGL